MHFPNKIVELKHPENQLESEKSFAIKILKFIYTKRAIEHHKMDQVIVFCRTKLDCDNMEKYFVSLGGGILF